MMMTRRTVPARKGAAVRMDSGERLMIHNTHGTQVVDFWAVRSDDPEEHLSMVHTRTALARLVPRAGDVLHSNRRQPILRFVEDTSPGVHDTVVAPCDPYRYQQLGVEGFHDSCVNNFLTAMREEMGVERPWAPDSFNLFMNIPWTADGELSFQPTVSRPGDYVAFEALAPVYAVVSSCPQDILPINSNAPMEFDVELLPAP
jgi:uncharacterized protein YcgI (DUF1989 family)